MLLPHVHSQRGKIIGCIVDVVVVISTKTARCIILGEFASANCIRNRTRTRVRALKLSKRDHESCLFVGRTY